VVRSAPQARGSVSVEFALTLPAVVLVLAWSLAAVAWGLDAAQAQRTAAEGARVALTESDARALEVVRSRGREARVVRTDQVITVCVSVPARLLLPTGERCAWAWARP